MALPAPSDPDCYDQGLLGLEFLKLGWLRPPSLCSYVRQASCYLGHCRPPAAVALEFHGDADSQASSQI